MPGFLKRFKRVAGLEPAVKAVILIAFQRVLDHGRCVPFRHCRLKEPCARIKLNNRYDNRRGSKSRKILESSGSDTSLAALAQDIHFRLRSLASGKSVAIFLTCKG